MRGIRKTLSFDSIELDQTRALCKSLRKNRSQLVRELIEEKYKQMFKEKTEKDFCDKCMAERKVTHMLVCNSPRSICTMHRICIDCIVDEGLCPGCGRKLNYPEV